MTERPFERLYLERVDDSPFLTKKPSRSFYERLSLGSFCLPSSLGLLIDSSDPVLS